MACYWSCVSSVYFIFRTLTTYFLGHHNYAKLLMVLCLQGKSRQHLKSHLTKWWISALV